MAKIQSIISEVIKDSRGEDTISVAVGLDNGMSGTVAIPQGKSTGAHEAKYVDPEKAVENIKNIIEPELRGFGTSNQEGLDKRLMGLDGTENKGKLGANAILGVSLAYARSSALAENIQLWEYFRKVLGKSGRPDKVPRIFVNVINGGLHAENNLDFQEYLIIPVSKSTKESLDTAYKIIKQTEVMLEQSGKEIRKGDEGGFAPDFYDNFEPFEVLSQAIRELKLEGKIDFGLDAAANGVDIPESELHDIYDQMKQNYGLWYLEDPFSENDFEKFAKLQERLGKDVVVTGDDLTVTNIERINEAKGHESITGVIIKPNQIGTVSESIYAIRQAKDLGWTVVVSHRSGETMDDFIADLAYGSGADGLKAGSPTQKERLIKYKRLVEIENAQ